MQTQKFINLLNDLSNEESKFGTKNVMSQTVKQKKDKYNKNNSTKLETESTKSSLCDYCDAFILITGDIAGNAGNNTDVAFKNYAPFSHVRQNIITFLLMKQIIFTLQFLCTIRLNIVIIIQTSGSLWQFKRAESPADDAELSVDNSQSLSI